MVSQNQGQQGFIEGNALQYTWSVPQDLSQLFALMGGDSTAISDLNAFFSQLNAGPFLPYDWAGNEPSLWTPWEYDYAGAPWRTQQVVRSIADSLYAVSPAGEPGNDDLGAMSSWYVWAALGLYPLTPGTANLVIASPMFPSSTIYLPSGKVLTVTGQGAPDDYVQSAQVALGSGGSEAWNQSWLPSSILRRGGALNFTLGSAPDMSWAADIPTALVYSVRRARRRLHAPERSRADPGWVTHQGDRGSPVGREWGDDGDLECVWSGCQRLSVIGSTATHGGLVEWGDVASVDHGVGDSLNGWRSICSDQILGVGPVHGDALDHT